jgi:formyltetrahydrofolate deformylase
MRAQQHNDTSVQVLSFRASDGPGLVAAIADAVAAAGGNILDVGQHSDVETGLFACRLEVDAAVDLEAMKASFDELAATRSISWEHHDAEERARVVLACSRSLPCVSDLLTRSAIGELDCEIAGVVSDKTDAAELAERFDVPFWHLPVGEDRSTQEHQLGELLESLDPDLVVLARYMRVLPAGLAERWENRMINIHHALLPAFAGAAARARAYERGVKIIGATAHYVTPELDGGPIITQDVVRITHRDGVEDLVRAGDDVERTVLASAVRLHLEHRVIVFGNRTCIFD